MWTIIKRINKISQITLIIFLILTIPLVSYSNIYDEYLLTAARYGNLKRVIYCIEAGGANVNYADKGGNTALMTAIQSAWYKEYVKKKGRQHRDRNGQYIEVVKILLAQGADVHAKDKYGYTAIHLAADITNTEIMELLLAHGANVNAKSKDGTTPVHRAANNFNADTMELLLAHGADVNAKTKNGYTAIIGATKWDRLGIVKVLINNGADVNLGVFRGDNALMLVKKRYSNKKTAERAAIIEMLIAAGAKPVGVKAKKLTAKRTSKVPKVRASTKSKDKKIQSPENIIASEKSIVLQDHHTATTNSRVIPYGRKKLITLFSPVIEKSVVQIPFKWEKESAHLNKLKIIGFVRGANLVEGASIVKFFHHDKDGSMYDNGWGYKKINQKFLLRMKHDLHGKARIALFAVYEEDMSPPKINRFKTYQALSNVVFINFTF
jgi:ankyrin repeat protein